MDKNAIVVWGIGEIGSVLARAFLRAGHPVLPVTRDINFNRLAGDLPDPEMVIVAVGEKNLSDILKQCPKAWHPFLVLIQNELLPRDWAMLTSPPTVMSVWFEKKRGQDVKVVIPSQVYGKHAEVLKRVLGEFDIPCEIPRNFSELVTELVVKNLYILTTNICGLSVGGNVGELWANHRSLLRDTGNEVLGIQACLVEQSIDCEALFIRLKIAFDGDPEHQCMGRSAPERLKRAIALAEEHDVNVPKLMELANHVL